VNAPLRAIVADDEPLARARLRRLLAQFDGVDVVAECATGQAAVEALHRLGADVAFLDIQMPDLDGFDVLESLPRLRRPHVVFVTAYSEHAVRAFEARAVDYLLKPVSAERLRQAIERIRFASAPAVAAAGSRPGADADAPTSYAPRIAVPCGTRIHLVPVDDIDHVQAQANYVELHIGARSLVLRDAGQLRRAPGPDALPARTPVADRAPGRRPRGRGERLGPLRVAPALRRPAGDRAQLCGRGSCGVGDVAASTPATRAGCFVTTALPFVPRPAPAVVERGRVRAPHTERRHASRPLDPHHRHHARRTRAGSRRPRRWRLHACAGIRARPGVHAGTV